MAAAINPSVCFECNAPADHDHHVVPRSLGGTKTVPLCERCHGVVHERGGMVGHRALTRAAFARMRAEGRYKGGSAPYGYVVDADGKLVEDPGEQSMIAIARALRGRGMSLRAVAATLDERGVRSRVGRPFAAAQVARMVATR